MSGQKMKPLSPFPDRTVDPEELRPKQARSSKYGLWGFGCALVSLGVKIGVRIFSRGEYDTIFLAVWTSPLFLTAIVVGVTFAARSAFAGHDEAVLSRIAAVAGLVIMAFAFLVAW